MHLPRLLLPALCAVALGAPLAPAQLFLTGRITAGCTDPTDGYATAFNASDGSMASFYSGVPERAADFQTSVVVDARSFTHAGAGLLAGGLFNVTNGRTLLGTTADHADFDLSIELSSPETGTFLLTAVPFHIVNTPNGPGSVPDVYSIFSSPIPALEIDHYRVQFTFTAPASFSLDEDTSRRVGDLSVAFTAVPEPAAYAGGAATLLVGLAAARRVRRRAETA